MGKEIAQHFPEAREIFSRADAILGISLSQLMSEGPEEDLRRTVNAQPAVVAVSLACFRILEAMGVTFAATAGHSVGEYAALAAAGVIDVETALSLLRVRGRLMQSAGDTRPGTMAAVMGITFDQVEDLCAKAREGDILEIANINSPDQVVISGDVSAVGRAVALAPSLGAKRAVPLAVSAAFHSPLMGPVAEELARELDGAEFRDAKMPVILNVTGMQAVSAEEIRAALKRQLMSRVHWLQSVQEMIGMGIGVFIEAGPGTALSGMVRKISKDVEVSNFQDMKSLEKLKETLFAFSGGKEA
jgi:[acyl-carrier-protein] S-malonyltransferase